MIDAWRFALTVDKRLEQNTSFVLGVDKHNVPFKAKTSGPSSAPHVPQSPVARGFHMGMGACIFVLAELFLIFILPTLIFVACECWTDTSWLEGATRPYSPY
jgi:hypothetical protein